MMKHHPGAAGSLVQYSWRPCFFCNCVALLDPQLLLVAKAKDLKSDAKLFKAFREVAVSNKGKMVFVTVDADGSSKDPVMNFFGLKDEDTPAVIGFHMASNKKYRLREAKLE
jgi:hypothetical protein